MSSRGYVKFVCCLGAILFLGTVIANVTIDPQDVFRLGFVQQHANPNTRFRRMKQYLENRTSIDGLAFASSRGGALDASLLARRMGIQRVLNVTIPYGLMTDHQPFLEFIVRDKQSRGEDISSVFLLLDADLFGTTPWTDHNIDAYLPPPIANTSRFWWRYLTAFQWRNWKKDLSLNFRARHVSTPAVLAGLGPPTLKLASTSRPDSEPVNFAESLDAPDVKRQLQLLRSFIALCRQKNIALTLAISPISTRNPVPPMRVRRMADAIASLHPLTDFSGPSAVSSEQRNWADASHFTAEIGAAIIESSFGTTTSFGIKRTPPTQPN
ncbi:hypothetical protein EDE08_10410 [Bradyrhizobium sp. R2.2-H]|uniref:hypothetical protein n=1 Tax=unclassified Bradyrhizobium TaxID=2631580 RepID=UPI0010434E41|nr:MULTISPECIES: hypothetical protein [unclassified Bradyrhizobium]TCU73961.1 hypothetical protein EDE10_104631 [Bradyrhizobium sp. Y-H1]TCU75848.1 hypothetical protein EDE08_10410 [Bradyrhizobium sp. R2.2-H]